jgi:hypothetical protein
MLINRRLRRRMTHDDFAFVTQAYAFRVAEHWNRELKPYTSMPRTLSDVSSASLGKVM